MRLFSTLPRFSLPFVRKLLTLICFLGIFFAFGYYLGRNGYSIEAERLSKIDITRQVPADKKADFALFWRVWDRLSTTYFDASKLDPHKMIYGAIQGMVAGVGDPYTVFLPPEENKVTQEDLEGNFDGIGIQIGYRGTQLAVIAPLDGSPAQRAGVKAGDYIEAIKDEKKNVDVSTSGMDLPKAVEIIRGPVGTKVTLALVREGVDKPIVLDIVRESINVPSVVLSWVGQNQDVAHVKLLKFGAETDSEWQKTVREILKKKETGGIVLDVRNNPGGYMQGAIDIASEFLKVGSVVVVEERANGVKSEYEVERTGNLLNIPLVVLINQGSASASEILAGALRDVRKTRLVGETTFGKGTIQQPEDLDGGAGLHVTIAKWLTPSGFWVNEKGLEPDDKIKDDAATTEDEQLQAAIKIL